MPSPIHAEPVPAPDAPRPHAAQRASATHVALHCLQRDRVRASVLRLPDRSPGRR